MPTMTLPGSDINYLALHETFIQKPIENLVTPTGFVAQNSVEYGTIFAVIVVFAILVFVFVFCYTHFLQK